MPFQVVRAVAPVDVTKFLKEASSRQLVSLQLLTLNPKKSIRRRKTKKSKRRKTKTKSKSKSSPAGAASNTLFGGTLQYGCEQENSLKHTPFIVIACLEFLEKAGSKHFQAALKP